MKSLRPLLALASLALFIVPAETDADAGWFKCHRKACTTTTTVKARVVIRSSVATVAPAAPTPAGYVAFSTPQAVQVQPSGADDAATFLALLNAARAQAGRPALAWDATLASYAAVNSGYDAYGRFTGHGGGSNPGCGQCWASSRSYVQAFHQWRASPAHWSILINATTSVGIAPCPVGTTCNAR